jgi:hypothetical protein
VHFNVRVMKPVKHFLKTFKIWLSSLELSNARVANEFLGVSRGLRHDEAWSRAPCRFSGLNFHGSGSRLSTVGAAVTLASNSDIAAHYEKGSFRLLRSQRQLKGERPRYTLAAPYREDYMRHSARWLHPYRTRMPRILCTSRSTYNSNEAWCRSQT